MCKPQQTITDHNAPQQTLYNWSNVTSGQARPCHASNIFVKQNISNFKLRHYRIIPFVLTLVPIAVAYHLSHYVSLLLTTGQLIIPLISDPMGLGWDLFGTASYRTNIGFASPAVIWYFSLTAIVVGHAIAVFLAHSVAVRVFGNRDAALASQIPMVGLMVAYTMLSLWIVAQPIVG